MADPALENPDPDAPELIGGEFGQRAFQSVEDVAGQRSVTPVPRATLVEPAPLGPDFGPFMDLVPGGRQPRQVGGIDFGQFSDLVPPPPPSLTPHTDQAVSEPMEIEKQVAAGMQPEQPTEQIGPTPSVFRSLAQGDLPGVLSAAKENVMRYFTQRPDQYEEAKAKAEAEHRIDFGHYELKPDDSARMRYGKQAFNNASDVLSGFMTPDSAAILLATAGLGAPAVLARAGLGGRMTGPVLNRIGAGVFAVQSFDMAGKQLARAATLPPGPEREGEVVNAMTSLGTGGFLAHGAVAKAPIRPEFTLTGEPLTAEQLGARIAGIEGTKTIPPDLVPSLQAVRDRHADLQNQITALEHEPVRDIKQIRHLEDQQIENWKQAHALLKNTPAEMLIIGGGSAGLEAAAHGGSEGYHTVLLEGSPSVGGQAKTSGQIVNVTGKQGVRGDTFYRDVERQVSKSGAQIRKGTPVQKLWFDKETGLWNAQLADKSVVQGHNVAVSTGLKARPATFPGAEFTTNNGLTLAREGKGGTVVVTGGGNSAGQAAINTARKARKVILISRRPLAETNMSDPVRKQIEINPKIEVVTGDQVASVEGANGQPHSVTTKNGRVIPRVGGVGTFFGGEPISGFLPENVRTKSGHIAVNDRFQVVDSESGVPVPGLYAVGDATTRPAMRIDIARGNGADVVKQIGQRIAEQRKGGKVPVSTTIEKPSGKSISFTPEIPSTTGPSSGRETQPRLATLPTTGEPTTTATTSKALTETSGLPVPTSLKPSVIPTPSEEPKTHASAIAAARRALMYGETESPDFPDYQPPTKGGEPGAKEPNRPTDQVPTEQGKPVVPETESEVQAGDTRTQAAQVAEAGPEAAQLAGQPPPPGAGAGIPPPLPPAYSFLNKPLKSKREIIRTISEVLGIPFRFGRLLHPKSGGYFLPRAELVALKRRNDIPSAAHEAGHKLDKMFKFQSDPNLFRELNVLGDPSLPGSRSSWKPGMSPSYRRGEGVGEFVRHWLVNPNLADVAPKMKAAFEAMLESNKDIQDVFLNARNDIQLWKTAEGMARIQASISIGDNPNKTPYTLSQLTRDLVDDLHFGKMASDDASKGTGKKLLPSQDIYILQRLLRGSYGAADAFIKYGIADAKTGEMHLGTSYEDALRPTAGREKEFRIYSVSRQADEMHKKGLETGLNPNDVRVTVARYANDPVFLKAFDDTVKWRRAVIQYAADLGLIQQSSVDAMFKQWQDYVPMHRIFEVGAGEPPAQEGSGTGRGLNVGTPGSLRPRKGSPADIVDPHETDIKNAYTIITAAEKAYIHRALSEMADIPGMGKWIERIGAPKEPVKVPFDRIKKQLEDAGADVSKVPDDLLMMYFRQGKQAPFGENIIRVTRNGKDEFLRLNSDLFQTFHALDMESSGKLMRILSAPAQLLRAGVVLEPGFSLANSIRDTISAAVLSKYGALPFETTIRGLFSMFGSGKAGKKLIGEWMVAGGKNSVEAHYFDRDKTQKFLKQKILDLKPEERGLIMTPLHALRRLNERAWMGLRTVAGISEEATRIGEYQIGVKKLVKQGMPIGEARRLAAFESRDRQDFAKGGAATKSLRMMTPFWNAAMQGNVRLFQGLFSKDPKVRMRTWMQGFAYVTLPKLLEQAINWDDPDYWDRPRWERLSYFMFPYGKDESGHTKFIRINSPFEIGSLFAALPGTIIEWYRTHDPAAMKGYLQNIQQQLLPNPTPNWALSIFENFAGPRGFDFWRGRPIVSESVADEAPELQYTDQTSEAAKKLGAMLGMSPQKIDHVIEGQLGGLGKLATGKRLPWQRFITTPINVSSQSTQDFYDTWAGLKATKSLTKAGRAQIGPEAALLVDFNKSARRMSELRKIARTTTDPSEKEQAQEQIYQIAKRTMEYYRANK